MTYVGLELAKTLGSHLETLCARCTTWTQKLQNLNFYQTPLVVIFGLWILGTRFRKNNMAELCDGGGDRCQSGGQGRGLRGGERALIFSHPQVIQFGSGNHWLAPFTSADQEQKYHSVKNGLRAPVVKQPSLTSRVQDPWLHPSIFCKS